MAMTTRTMRAAALFALALAACGKKDDKKAQPAPATGDAGGGSSGSSGSSATKAVDAAAAAPAPAAGTVRFGEPSFSHPDALDRIVVGPGGSVLTCSRIAVRLWAASGKLTWGHAGALRAGACALSADGKRVAVIEQKGDEGAPYQPRVFDVGGGDRWVGGPATATALALDGDALVTVQRDQVQRWTDGKPAPLATLPAAARDAVFSADGKAMAWTDGSKVYLHDVGAEATALPATADGEIKHVALSADRTKLALAADRKVTLWDVAGAKAAWTAKLELSVPHAPAVAFRADGAVLASRVQKVVTIAAADGQVTVPPPAPRFLGWTATGAARVLEGKDEYAVAVDSGARGPAVDDGTPDWADEQVIGADGAITAWTAEECAALRVWRGGAERTLPAPAGCDAERGGIQGWRVGPNRAIAIGKAATVFDLADGKALATIPIEERPLEELAVSADGGTVVAVFGVMPPTDDAQLADRPDRNQLYLATWSIAGDGTSAEKAHGLRPTDDVSALAVSADGAHAYLGLRSGHVVTVDTSTFAESARRGPQSSEVTSIDVEARSGRVAATDLDNATTIYPR